MIRVRYWPRCSLCTLTEFVCHIYGSLVEAFCVFCIDKKKYLESTNVLKAFILIHLSRIILKLRFKPAQKPSQAGCIQIILDYNKEQLIDTLYAKILNLNLNFFITKNN